MAREKEDFRDNLERLTQAFPDKQIILMKDIQAYTGKCYNSIKSSKEFPKKKVCGGYTLVSIARWLS